MLRKRLTEMTEVSDVAQHPQLLSDLTIECPNSITILDSPYPINRYTCLVHVFDFIEKPEYIAVAGYGLGRVFASPDFADWLIDHGFLTERTESEAKEGDIVFYLNDGEVKHAGRLMSGGRVVSKWGIGQLYEHALFEVPDCYGNHVRFFEPPSYQKAYGHFTHFAQECGIPFKKV